MAKIKLAAARMNLPRLILVLAKIGWGRPCDIVLFEQWPGKQAEEVVRDLCVWAVADGLLVSKPLEGTPGELAYMLTDRGDRHARQLGAKIIGRSHNLKVGPRWHEHVMAIAMAVAMRKYKFEFYFAREVKWAIRELKSTQSSGSAHLPALLDLGVHLLAKFPDGILVRGGDRPATAAVELEWSEKKGDDIQGQVASCMQARNLDIKIMIGYVYPPEMQKALLERRAKYRPKKRTHTKLRHAAKPQKAINHEGRMARNFFARASSKDELDHISLMRMRFDIRLRFQGFETVKLREIVPQFRQALGTTSESKAKDPDWSISFEQLQGDKVVAHDFEHLPSGCWLRLVRHDSVDEDHLNGWEFLAWMEPDSTNSPIGHPDANTTHELTIPQARYREWSFEKAVREAKKWFLQQRETHLTTLGRR
jgi:hypothetical protein